MTRKSLLDGKYGKTFQHMPDATLNQANPVSGTKYTVLDTTKNTRVLSISVVVTWTVQPSPLEVHVTIDGQSIRHYIANPVSATQYFAAINMYEIPTNQALDTNQQQERAFLWVGRSVKVEVETTGGTTSNLSSRVKYGIMP